MAFITVRIETKDDEPVAEIRLRFEEILGCDLLKDCSKTIKVQEGPTLTVRVPTTVADVAYPPDSGLDVRFVRHANGYIAVLTGSTIGLDQYRREIEAALDAYQARGTGMYSQRVAARLGIARIDAALAREAAGKPWAT